MKKGFTLSEVIITLGIIGVVAALTIPAVVNNYRYKMYSSQLKKVYSQLETAARNAISDEMASSFYSTTSGTKGTAGDCTKGPCYFLTNYFKNARTNCGNASVKKCIGDVYISSSGKSAGTLISAEDSYCVQTTNGSTICAFNNDSTSYKTRIAFDVNGPEAPNTIGIDAFVAQINDNGQIEDLDSDIENCGKEADGDDIFSMAPGCLTKVINNSWVITD